MLDRECHPKYTNTYDERGNLLRERFSDDQYNSYTYAENGALVQITKYTSAVTIVFDIDEKGYLIKATLNWNDGSYSGSNEYNSEGVLIRETDP